jgi:hypothetical protein
MHHVLLIPDKAESTKTGTLKDADVKAVTALSPEELRYNDYVALKKQPAPVVMPGSKPFGSLTPTSTTPGAPATPPDLHYESMQWPQVRPAGVRTAASYFDPTKDTPKGIAKEKRWGPGTVPTTTAGAGAPTAIPISQWFQPAVGLSKGVTPMPFPTLSVGHIQVRAPVFDRGDLEIVTLQESLQFRRKGCGSIEFHPDPYPRDPIINDPRIVELRRGFVGLNFEDPGNDRGLEGMLISSPARIVLEKVWEKNEITGMRPQRSNGSDNEYEEKLREYCARKRAKFMSYEEETGTLTFEIENFRESGGVFDFP